MVCIGSPLKNVGFQIYKGATPHFKKMHVKSTNHETPITITSLIVDVRIRKLKTCSIKNQSRVKTFVYKSKINKNKFKEETRETQKK